MKHLKLGVNDAVSHLNIGHKATVLTFEKLQMIPGSYTLQGCIDLNKKRLSQSFYDNISKNKTRRKKIRSKKFKVQDNDEEKEGKVYEAGGYEYTFEQNLLTFVHKIIYIILVT